MCSSGGEGGEKGVVCSTACKKKVHAVCMWERVGRERGERGRRKQGGGRVWWGVVWGGREGQGMGGGTPETQAWQTEGTVLSLSVPANCPVLSHTSSHVTSFHCLTA